jgi:hypothetical protein
MSTDDNKALAAPPDDQPGQWGDGDADQFDGTFCSRRQIASKCGVNQDNIHSRR